MDNRQTNASISKSRPIRSSSFPPFQRHPHSSSSRRLAMHQCIVCNKTFSRADNLRSHYRIHTGEMPFNCSYCDRPFRWLSALRNHEDMHIVREMRPVQSSQPNQTQQQQSQPISHRHSQSEQQRLSNSSQPNIRNTSSQIVRRSSHQLPAQSNTELQGTTLHNTSPQERLNVMNQPRSYQPHVEPGRMQPNSIAQTDNVASSNRRLDPHSSLHSSVDSHQQQSDDNRNTNDGGIDISDELCELFLNQDNCSTRSEPLEALRDQVQVLSNFEPFNISDSDSKDPQ